MTVCDLRGHTPLYEKVASLYLHSYVYFFVSKQVHNKRMCHRKNIAKIPEGQRTIFFQWAVERTYVHKIELKLYTTKTMKKRLGFYTGKGNVFRNIENTSRGHYSALGSRRGSYVLPESSQAKSCLLEHKSEL